MSRKVTQVSPKTVIRHKENGTRDTIWAAGLKFDKYAGDEVQHISADYFEPQEVQIELAEQSKWGSSTSADRLTMITNNGEKIARWQATSKGVKFFKTQELAEQYFLFVTHNLFKKTESVMKLHSQFLDKLSHDCPHFVNEL